MVEGSVGRTNGWQELLAALEDLWGDMDGSFEWPEVEVGLEDDENVAWGWTLCMVRHERRGDEGEEGDEKENKADKNGK